MNYKLAGFGRQTQLLFFELMSAATRVTRLSCLKEIQFLKETTSTFTSFSTNVTNFIQSRSNILRGFTHEFNSIKGVKEQFLEQDAPVTS